MGIEITTFVLYLSRVSPKAGIGKLSSEMHWSLSNAISFPRSRQLSLVTLEGDYAISVLRNYEMQAENRYSYFIIAKVLISLRSLKHSKNGLEKQFVIYKDITAVLLRSIYSHSNRVLLSCIWHNIFLALRVVLLQ